MYVVGIDIGGTFTDVIVLDTEKGQISSRKTMTTPENLVEGVLHGLKSFNIGLGQVERIVHGTTICTNCLIEGKQAKTGFIATRGFGDEFDIQRMVRRWGKTSWSSIYDLHQQKPAPYVPRHLRMEVDERVVYPGIAIREPDREDVEDKVEKLKKEHVEAIGVAFLWSFLHPEHERRVEAIIRETFPEAKVSLSYEVTPTFREYERMVTTAVNASLMPILNRYLSEVEEALHREGCRGALLLMQSHGGVGYPAVINRLPIATLRGGPVGGVMAATWLGRTLGRQNLISCDVGGTSCDTSVILRQIPSMLDEMEVNYYPVRVPTVDISCIGAGGGSIATIDVAGALQVGPESAGSDPGPACYGRDGTEPTLTDASLVLARLDPLSFSESGIRPRPELARQSMGAIGSRLGWNETRVADAIVRIAVANMATAIRLQTIDRGHDPREFSLVAFGGAGPLYATLLAEETSVPEVIIPPMPGVFSTFGMVVSELAYYGQSTFLKPLEGVTAKSLDEEYRKLEDQGREVLRRSNVREEEMRFVRSAAMRYALQEWELRVPVPVAQGGEGSLDAIARAFHEAHRARHGFAREDAAVEFVTLHLDCFGPAPKFAYPRLPQGTADADAAIKSRRAVFIDETTGTAEIPVYDRHRLQAGNVLNGPALVEERTATTFISPRWQGRVDERGNILLMKIRGQFT